MGMNRKMLAIVLLGLSHCKGEKHTQKAGVKKTNTPSHHEQESKTTPAKSAGKKSETSPSGIIVDKEVHTLVLEALSEAKALEILNKFKGRTFDITSIALAELVSNAMDQLMMLEQSNSNVGSMVKKLIVEVQKKLGAVLLCLFLESGVCFNLDLPSMIMVSQIKRLNLEMKNMQFCPEEDKQKLLKALESGNPEKIRKVQSEVSKSIFTNKEELQQFIDKLLCKTFDSCMQRALSELERSSSVTTEEAEEDDDWEDL